MQQCGHVSVQSDGLQRVGSVMAILQNELVYKSFDPRGREMNVLKALNSISTLACLACIYINYHLKVYIFRVNRHCRSLTPLEWRPVPPEILFRRPDFWIEILFFGCHCPPFFTAEVWTETIDNLVVYRIETLAALFNMCRVYLLWKYVRDRQLLMIPKRHLVNRFTGAEFDSMYVLKELLRGRHGPVTIAFIWLLAIWVGAYSFRAGVQDQTLLLRSLARSLHARLLSHAGLHARTHIIVLLLYACVDFCKCSCACVHVRMRGRE